MDRILLLGGSMQQIPAIEYAREQGYYTVLCDYLPDNPGQHKVDRFYCVSTTDKDAVLQVAKRESIDGIVAYASDPAAPTAAYVAEQLGLPSNPYESVITLAYKDRFRSFLQENGFNCPLAEAFSGYQEAEAYVGKFTFPVIVKPVDSSGSKGVTKVESPSDLKLAFQNALNLSRIRRVIGEEFIVQDHPYMIAGDCFVIDGEVAFWGLLNSHRDTSTHPFVPVGTSFPVAIPDTRIKIVKDTLQRLFDILHIKFGAFNVEVMFDKDNKVYLVEVGPRNGGNMIPDLLPLYVRVVVVEPRVK